jgi:hypothetical protein
VEAVDKGERYRDDEASAGEGREGVEEIGGHGRGPVRWVNGRP